MISEKDIVKLIQQSLPQAQIYVKNPLRDGEHFHALIIDEGFEGMSLLSRQRLVMKPLGHMIGNEIHALSIKTLTPGEFEKRREELSKFLQ